MRLNFNWDLSPVCFALFPIFGRYAANVDSVAPIRVIRPSLVSLALALTVWLILRLISKDTRKAAVGTCLVLIMFFGYRFLWKLMRTIPPIEERMGWDTFFYVWLLITAAIAIVAAFRSGPILSSFFRISGYALLATSSVTLALGILNTKTDLNQRLSAALPEGGLARDLGSRPPDIYYIVLDGYGRADALKDFVGFDNSEFIVELRARGFIVADKSTSNYAQTELSLASSMNMDYVERLIPKLNPDSEDRNQLDQLIDSSAVKNYLGARGYRTLGVVSGFDHIHVNSYDHVYRDDRGITMFESLILNSTPFAAPLQQFGSEYELRRQRIVRAFGVVGRVVRNPLRPHFLFAHIFAPHPPFVFQADGSPLNPDRPYTVGDGDDFLKFGGTLEEYRLGYIGQIQYTNKLLLNAIDQILARADSPPPVIILQGDHGSKLRLKQNSAEGTEMKEAFSNLTAIFGPKELVEPFPDDITPVNIFRILLTRLFDAGFPELPNRNLYSTWARPYIFEDRTEELRRYAEKQGSEPSERVAATDGKEGR